MLKNTYFFEKSCRIRFSIGGSALEPDLPTAVGGSASRPPSCYSLVLLQLCLVRSMC